MDTSLKIYGSLHDRGYRIAWACEELGLDYTLHPLDLSKGEHLGPAYKAINPYQKVPTLIDDQTTVIESGAILYYLATGFQDHAVLIPKEMTKKRVQYEQWMYFAFTELEPPLWTKAKHSFVYPEAMRVPAIKIVAEQEYAKACKHLANHLAGSGPYILGDPFQMVDVCIAYLLRWGQKAKMPVESSVLNEYLNRIQKRPAMQKLTALTPTDR